MAESKQKDAVALLKEDHRTVEDLFAQFEKASGDDRKQELATQICTELSIHAQIEEEIFYPACEGKVEEDLLKEAYVEHDGAKVLIAEPLADAGVELLRTAHEVDARTSMTREELLAAVGGVDALVVRSATRVDAEVLEAGRDLKVVGPQLDPQHPPLSCRVP